MLKNFILCFFLLSQVISLQAQNRALVYQTDFGLKDGAVAAMKGVAFSVSPELKQYDLTHEIPPYDIWQAAYRLQQTVSYWPSGTVFVSVVDPGVGSERKSVVAKTRSGHFIVTPDNGTLTLIAATLGIDSLRQIDEKINRLKGSGDSYTFHGRDVYSYTGARLAAGVIRFDEVGPTISPDVVRITYQPAEFDAGKFLGNIPILDIQYGNVWTNIPFNLLKSNGITYGDSLQVRIFYQKKPVYSGKMIFGTTFSAVKAGMPVAYINSLLNLSFGINMGSFAGKHRIDSGGEWSVVVAKVP